MHKTIKVGCQTYELQIAVRKIINDGKTAVSMDDAETRALIAAIDDDLRSAIGVIDYAAEQREYEASFETDTDTRHSMMNTANDWVCLGNRLLELVEAE